MLKFGNARLPSLWKVSFVVCAFYGFGHPCHVESDDEYFFEKTKENISQLFSWIFTCFSWTYTRPTLTFDTWKKNLTSILRNTWAYLPLIVTLCSPVPGCVKRSTCIERSPKDSSSPGAAPSRFSARMRKNAFATFSSTTSPTVKQMTEQNVIIIKYLVDLYNLVHYIWGTLNPISSNMMARIYRTINGSTVQLSIPLIALITKSAIKTLYWISHYVVWRKSSIVQ